MSVPSRYPIKISIDLAITEAKRELAIREKTLHRWAGEGKFGMTSELADYRIRCQQQIIALLERLKENGGV